MGMRKILIVRGQNSGLYQEQYRQYYGIFRVERAPRPNAAGDSVMVQIAENCTKEDATDLVTAVNHFEEMREACEAALARFKEDRVEGYHEQHPVILLERVLAKIKEE